MKSAGILLRATVWFVAAAAPARADDASKVAKVEEMLRLMHADQMIQQVMAQLQPIMANQLKQLNLPPESAPAAEEMQKKMFELLTEKLNWQKLRPMYVKLYADTFTEEELAEIVNFYKTPGGQALLDKMPSLMQKSVQLSQGMMSDLIPEISQIVQEISKKYQRK